MFSSRVLKELFQVIFGSLIFLDSEAFLFICAK